MALALVGLELLSRYRRRKFRQQGDYAMAWWGAALRASEQLLHGLARGQAIFRFPARASLATVAGLLSWIAQILGILWTFRAFGIELGLGAAALVFFTSTLIQLFPVVPANVGVFQLAVVFPLNATYGVDPTRALSFAIGLQLIEALLGVGLGFLFLSREGLSLAEARRLPADDASSG
jgi:uncharacterized membrane protein YbhN (UPF0104 family)